MKSIGQILAQDEPYEWTDAQWARYQAEREAYLVRHTFERVMGLASRHLPPAVRESNRRLRASQEQR